MIDVLTAIPAIELLPETLCVMAWALIGKPPTVYPAPLNVTESEGDGVRQVVERGEAGALAGNTTESPRTGIADDQFAALFHWGVPAPAPPVQV